MLRRVDLARASSDAVRDHPPWTASNAPGSSRGVCDSDARVVYAKLTEKGAKRLESASKSHLGSVRSLFGERFDEEELERLFEFLSRLPQTKGATDCGADTACE